MTYVDTENPIYVATAEEVTVYTTDWTLLLDWVDSEDEISILNVTFEGYLVYWLPMSSDPFDVGDWALQ